MYLYRSNETAPRPLELWIDLKALKTGINKCLGTSYSFSVDNLVIRSSKKKSVSQGIVTTREMSLYKAPDKSMLDAASEFRSKLQSERVQNRTVHPFMPSKPIEEVFQEHFETPKASEVTPSKS